MNTLPQEDIDSAYNTEEASALVDQEFASRKNLTPKKATKTTSFYMVLGTVLAGVVVTFLIGAGIIPEDMKDSSTQVFAAIIAGSIAWVIGKFVESRGQVAVAKVQATAELALEEQRQAKAVSTNISAELVSVPQPTPYMGITTENILSLLPMFISLAIASLGEAKGNKKKVLKALKAALTAFKLLS
jgi:hypothetical protein